MRYGLERLTEFPDYYQHMENEMAEESKTVTVGDDTVKVSEAPGWQNWKTFLFGIALTVFGGLQVTDLATVIPAQYVGWVMSAIGLITIWLRSQATGPMLSNVKTKVV
jgi:hypothetical protein